MNFFGTLSDHKKVNVGPSGKKGPRRVATAKKTPKNTPKGPKQHAQIEGGSKRFASFQNSMAKKPYFF